MSRLWFLITTRRECCVCGAWLGGSNPFARRKTHGYCHDCALDQERALMRIREDFLKTNLFTFGGAGRSYYQSKKTTSALETGEQASCGKDRLITGATVSQPHLQHNLQR
jgi:hypothetical protein